MGQHLRQGWEDGLGLVLACNHLQDLEGNLDLALAVGCTMMEEVDESQYAAVEDKDVYHLLAEEDTEPTVVAAQED